VRVQYKRKQQARIALAILIVAIGGCNSDGTATPTSKPATTLPPGDSAVATRSTTTTTSTTTTSLAPTTLAPTTTTIPIEQQIKDAIQAYYVAYSACGLKPAECDVTTFAAAGSKAEKNAGSYFAEMAKRSLYFDVNDPLSYLVTTSVVTNSPTQATADTCAFDDGRILGPAGTDGQPSVIADGNQSSTIRQIWTIDSGAWKLQQEDQIEVLGSGDQCGGH
jgi:hypothetical protein